MPNIIQEMKKPAWSEIEVENLKNLWPNASLEEIKKGIPNRSWGSIRNKASRMEFKRILHNRNINGTFKRIIKPFSLENFNDGWIDNKGRFRVYLPNHPRAYPSGYVLRSIIAYELYHGVEVPPNMDIHHIDKNRLNDSKENLEMMRHREHSILSNLYKKNEVIRICKHCGKEFKIKKWRLKNPRRGQFCSLKCYHSQKRSISHRKNISEGLKKSHKKRKEVNLLK